MMEKEEMETRLYERMSQKNDAFMADLTSKPANEIIRCAYEIACKDNLLTLFEEETSLTPKQLEILLEFEHPLDHLYRDLLNRDTNEMDNFRNSIESCANDILNRRAKEKYDNPTQPLDHKFWQDARACDEHPEWMADHRRSQECARMFRKEASNA